MLLEQAQQNQTMVLLDKLERRLLFLQRRLGDELGVNHPRDQHDLCSNVVR